MADNTLFDRCHVNTNIESDVFVGIRKKEDHYEVNFPLGYHLGTDEKELRKDILSLMNVLARNTDKKESELHNGINEDNVGVPIQAYLFLIKDYFDRGYYKEQETFYTVAKKGKINWGKTIKTQKPVMQDNEVFYLDFIVKKNTINDDELITLAHKYCVYESFKNIGWLFTSFVPARPKTGLNIKMMIAVVTNKLQHTFKDQNKQLFRNMLMVLKQLDDDSKTEFMFGTYRFEYVWEKMIDRIFGIPEKLDYFAKTKWNLQKGNVYENSFLEPDSIMLCNGKIYVLDAKYYKYGWSGAPGHLPESASINKQITYGEYIATADKFRENGKAPEVYNAFIMPYDSKGKMFPTNQPIYFIGTAVSEWKSGMEKYENVVGILMDVKYLMGLNIRLDQKEILQLAALIEENCPV